MISHIEFENFRVLRDSVLPLGPFTLLIGPNGSGKTTALDGLKAFQKHQGFSYQSVHAKSAPEGSDASLRLHWGGEHTGMVSSITWHPQTSPEFKWEPNGTQEQKRVLQSIRVFALQAEAIAAPSPLTAELELKEDGGGLAPLLDRLRDRCPDRFEAFTNDFRNWFPGYTHLMFDVREKQRVFSLQWQGGEEIPAHMISQGTLIALALLTLAHLPSPPQIIGLEELDHGLHPRLLRDVQQAVYRLAYPDQFGESRQPVQVVATTHSPYLLDLFREHPEEVVICDRDVDNVCFRRLSEMENIDDILQGSSLGEVWYSGVLGGVPVAP